MIRLTLDRASGVAPYRQIVQQVRAGVQLGVLSGGDQLPTTDALVAQLGVSRNTVGKAYHELKAAGLVRTAPGRGTFVAVSVAGADGHLRARLERWLEAARSAGLDDEAIRGLVGSSLAGSRRRT